MPRPAHNPQQAEFSSDAMVDTLAAQARAIWPQERRLFEAYPAWAGGIGTAVDVACGTGELTRRLAALWPDLAITGLDLDTAHLERARAACAGLGPRVAFAPGDAHALPLPDGAVDLAICRHLLQSMPDPGRVVAELVRVTRKGGVVHLIVEDYGMIQFHPESLDHGTFWDRGARAFGRALGSELFLGRRALPLLRRAGLVDLRCDYVVVDTLRCRADMRAIWAAWGRAYTASIAAHSPYDATAVAAHWADMDRTLADPDGYAVWQVPVWAGRVPGGG